MGVLVLAIPVSAKVLRSLGHDLQVPGAPPSM